MSTPTITITTMGMPIRTLMAEAESGIGFLGPLLQTSDSLFPSGGYAHSYGLEEMIALGRIRDAADLQGFLENEILPALANLELPYLRFCQEAARDKDVDGLLSLNEEISAWKLTREVREAGQAQGMQLMRMIREIYSDEWADCIASKLAEQGDTCQQIVATGLLRNLQGVPLESSLVAWTYQGVSNFCSASIKLLRLGEVACQRLIASCMRPDTLKPLIEQAMEVPRERTGWFNPVLDLASARHELAFSRLFIS